MKLFLSLFEDMFVDVREGRKREGGRGGEERGGEERRGEGRGGEKHRCEKETLISCLPYTFQLGDWTLNLGMYADWGWNLQHFGVWNDTPTNGATQLEFTIKLLKQSIYDNTHFIWPLSFWTPSKGRAPPLGIPKWFFSFLLLEKRKKPLKSPLHCIIEYR